MADPGVPRRVAAAIAEGLADDLTRDLGGRWRVEVDEETLPLGPDGEIRLTEHAPRLLREHSWDFVLYLTDLPTGPSGTPQLYDVSGSTAAALVSLPILGVFRVRSKVRALARKLVGASSGRQGLGTPGTAGLPSAKQTGPVTKVRLLAGMVLNNRPTRMGMSLTGVVAAAAGTGAFGIFYGSIAALAVALHPMRLLLISIVGVATLVTWLIVRNGLWNSSDQFTPGNRHLDNSATVVTVALGVSLMFLGLFAAMFLLALLVMDAGYLQDQLGRPVGMLEFSTWRGCPVVWALSPALWGRTSTTRRPSAWLPTACGGTSVARCSTRTSEGTPTSRRRKNRNGSNANTRMTRARRTATRPRPPSRIATVNGSSRHMPCAPALRSSAPPLLCLRATLGRATAAAPPACAASRPL